MYQYTEKSLSPSQYNTHITSGRIGDPGGRWLKFQLKVPPIKFENGQYLHTQMMMNNLIQIK